jgi:hypothetical protein
VLIGGAIIMAKNTVNIMFDDDTLALIDEKRGKISRSPFINNLVYHTLKESKIGE